MSTLDINITAPSETYKKATRSIVYRVSELMFGSLLAAYTLGFVAAIATHWTSAARLGLSGIFFLIVQYASISMTFAYATTGLYLTYQAGILTMPQLRLDRLAIDFSLAIIQALFFGFSVLRPWTFPVLLGISLIFAGRRQRTEHRALAEALYRVICRPGVQINSQNSVKFRCRLAELVRNDFPQLSGWAPTGNLIWFSAVTMILMGFSVGYLVVDFLPITWPFRDLWGLRNPARREFLITAEVVLLLVPIISYSHRVLKQRSTFLQTWADIADNYAQPSEGTSVALAKPGNKADPVVDLEFNDLRGELEELCRSFSQRSHAGGTDH